MKTGLTSILLAVILSAILSSGTDQTTPLRSLHTVQYHQAAEQTREVILVAQHYPSPLNHLLFAFDAESLGPLGYFALHGIPYSITISTDGHRLFIEEIPDGENGCCTLFALDLATAKEERLIFPSCPAVVTPDGQWLLTQRGNCGIELFDANSLTRRPQIDAPGLYELFPGSGQKVRLGL